MTRVLEMGKVTSFFLLCALDSLFTHAQYMFVVSSSFFSLISTVVPSDSNTTDVSLRT